MIRKKVLPLSDASFEACDRRIRIERNEEDVWDPDEWNSPFLRWVPKHGELRSDREAECPFADWESGGRTPNDGTVVIGISMYSHSGRSFALSGKGFATPVDRWDTTRDACYIYTDRSLWADFGPDTPWKPGDPEFEAEVRKEAETYVRLMNLSEQGSMWRWIEERKRNWTKRYDDGETVTGYDWEETDRCDGFLTDDVGDLNLPVDAGVPVFSNFFAGDEYGIPEYVVRRRNEGIGRDMYYTGGKVPWSFDPRAALRVSERSEAFGIAMSLLGKEASGDENVVEVDSVKA